MTRFYWNDYQESDLAVWQQKQSGNNCSFHAVCTALNMLMDSDLDGNKIASSVRNHWFPHSIFRYLYYPWAGMHPHQQRNLIKSLANRYSLPITAKVTHSTYQGLIEYLRKPDHVVLINIAWFWKAAPIYHGPQLTAGKIKPQLLSGHAMLLAAYDDAHQDRGGHIRPWGFINSWSNGKDLKNKWLYWMDDASFHKAWNFNLRAVVILHRIDSLTR
jgi:hypothetical protein